MSVALILIILYVVFYISLARKPRIFWHGSTFNINVVKSIKVFNTRFWPFFIYDFGYMQSKLYQYRPSLFRKYKRVTITAKDNELITMDIYERQGSDETPAVGCANPPQVVHNVLLVHGFNGSSKSSYITGLAYYLKDFRVFAFNARGVCSELKTQVFFHIGWTDDIEDAVNYILGNYEGALCLVGFSMGSSWVTNYLAKFDHPRIVGGAGVCVPFNFFKLKNILGSTMKSRMLAREFRKYLNRHQIFKDFMFNFDSVEEIDKNVTLKIFGFTSADEYYEKESCETKLHNIQKPMLFINSRDDPIIPYSSIPLGTIQENPNLILCIVTTGGHLGFFGYSLYKTFVDNALTDFLTEVTKGYNQELGIK